MLDTIYKTELEYIKCFSEFKEEENIIRFWDSKLLDMYCHNFTHVKHKLDSNQMIKLIDAEIEYKKAADCSFLRIETNLGLDPQVIASLPISPDITSFDIMLIPTARYIGFKGNTSAEILEASDRKVLRDGIDIEILGSSEAMEDFTICKIKRKSEVYAAPDNKLYWYICYYNGLPIGSCELFINGDVAKIEEFTVLDDYQRKGFGTSILKHLLEQAYKQGVQTAYLVTDSDDTAKDMYAKCGFTKVGQKTAVFFRL